MTYEQNFLLSLLLTLIVEIPVAVLIIRYFYKRKTIKVSKLIIVGFLASALTLPYFWFIWPICISNRGLYMVSGEFLIFILEALIYNQLLELKLSEAFVVSLVANMASMLLGLVIF